MNLDFTFSISEHLAWHWPIAVYLLLAGISGGAAAVTILMRYYQKNSLIDGVYKSMTLVSFVTIVFGMIFLVGDLSKPLMFWQILFNYNSHSVMSLGVMALIPYIFLTFLLCLVAFKAELKKYIPSIDSIVKTIDPFRKVIEALVLILGVIVCAYTGFLISVLERFPLLNTSILPALFLLSGLSAGIAATALVSVKFFKEKEDSKGIHILHTVELPIMVTEILFIFMLYAGLMIAGEAGQKALQAFSGSQYSSYFWVGVVGIGFIIPSIIRYAKAKMFVVSCVASIIGVLALRMFILYGGQAFGI